MNPDLIEIIEACPDTTLTLINKHRFVVQDSVTDVVERIVKYRARIADAAQVGSDTPSVHALQAIDSSDREQAA